MQGGQSRKAAKKQKAAILVAGASSFCCVQDQGAGKSTYILPINGDGKQDDLVGLLLNLFNDSEHRINKGQVLRG